MGASRQIRRLLGSFGGEGKKDASATARGSALPNDGWDEPRSSRASKADTHHLDGGEPRGTPEDWEAGKALRWDNGIR